MQTSNKETYKKPELSQIGSFEEVTLGGANGDFTDFPFPANTPRGDLTFS
jgi:hypothetical protein